MFGHNSTPERSSQNEANNKAVLLHNAAFVDIKSHHGYAESFYAAEALNGQYAQTETRFGNMNSLSGDGRTSTNDSGSQRSTSCTTGTSNDSDRSGTDSSRKSQNSSGLSPSTEEAPSLQTNMTNTMILQSSDLNCNRSFEPGLGINVRHLVSSPPCTMDDGLGFLGNVKNTDQTGLVHSTPHISTARGSIIKPEQSPCGKPIQPERYPRTEVSQSQVGSLPEA